MDDTTTPVPPLIRIADAGAMGRQLVTLAPRQHGEVIAPIDGYQILDRPTRTSIFIGNDRHLDALGLITNLNHACRPNTVVDTTRLLLIAARDLEPGDPLTFFYPSTEWEMASPFECLCGAPECIGLVRGARHVAPNVLANYFINRHIAALLEAESGVHTAVAPSPERHAAPRRRVRSAARMV